MKSVNGNGRLNGYAKWIVPSLIAAVLVLSAIVGQNNINANEEDIIDMNNEIQSVKEKVESFTIHIATDTLVTRQIFEKLNKIEVTLDDINTRLTRIEFKMK